MAGPLRAWNHGAKVALQAVSDRLSVEVKPFGIRVVVIEPDAIRNEFADVAVEALRAASPVPDPTDRSRRQSSSQWQMKTWSDASRHPRPLPTQFIGQ